MQRIQKLFLLAFLAFSFVSCSQNQDPVKLFHESDEAALKNNTAQFTIEYTNTDEKGTQKFSSNVSIEKIKDSKTGDMKYRIEEPGNTIITYDGTKFIVKDLKQKKISASSKQGFTDQLAQSLAQNFYMIIDNKLDTAEINQIAKFLVWEGDAKVDGINCYKISQKVDGHKDYIGENHYYFDKDNKLMIKYESKVTKKDGNKLYKSMNFVIKNLKLNEDIPANTFTQDIDTVNFKFEDIDKAHDMQNAEMGGENADGQSMEGHSGHGDMEQQSNGLLPKGSIAPNWTLKDKDGKSVSLSQLKGKVVILDFWATWCNPCKSVMPKIQKMHEAYKNKGVVFIGINISENADPVKFMKDNKYNYMLLLKGDDVAGQYKVQGIPTIYVIDKTGKIVYDDSGATENFEANITNAIQSCLK